MNDSPFYMMWVVGLEVFKSRRMGWIGPVEIEVYVQVWFEYLKERDHFGELGVDERIVLKCVVWCVINIYNLE
jgi:hypothetical protein